MKKGFTLIELIIVVIAISILATVAVPQYLKAIERAKSAKARHALGLVAQAEKSYRAEKDAYFAFTDGTKIDDEEGLGGFVELTDVQYDCSRTSGGDWCVTVDTGSDATLYFTATATRRSGSQKDATITLNQEGLWSGNMPKSLGGEGGK